MTTYTLDIEPALKAELLEEPPAALLNLAALQVPAIMVMFFAVGMMCAAAYIYGDNIQVFIAAFFTPFS